MNLTKRELVEMWLMEHRDIINSAGLDQRLGFPNGTFQKFFKYGRKLNQKRIIKIHRFLVELSVEKSEVKNQSPI